MSTLALVDASTWVSGFDFTTRLNELNVDLTTEAIEDTRFGTAGSPRKGRSRIGGLHDVETELNGFWESLDGNSADAAARSGLGTTRHVVTHSTTGAEQSTAYMYQARTFTYQLGDEIGAVLPFTLNIQGAGGNGSPGAVRGQVAAQHQTVSATGPLGSPVNVGDVADGEYLYAAFHVFGAGTSISVDLESAADQSFATPTVRRSFGPLDSTGGTWVARVPGPITDTWFQFDVTAITGTFTVAGAIGVK